MAKRATAKKREESDLIKALKFIQIAQDADGKTANEKHCRFINNYVVASNGILAAGAPTEEGIQAENACPHTFRLTEALERAGGQISLTMQPNWTLAIKSDKFNAIVPCVTNDNVYWIMPEDNAYSLTDNFRDAGERAGTFTRTGAERLIEACIMSTRVGLLGTNGICLIEAIHGSPFPPGLAIPKEFFAALNKISTKITGFGYSGGTGLTIWFEDRSFLRTQLYADANLPSLERLESIIGTPNPKEFPKGFFESVRMIASFSENDTIFIDNDEIRSHNEREQGAQVVQKIEEMSRAINPKYLLAIEPFCKWIDFEHTGGTALFFQNENTRGVISKKER